MCGGSRFTSVKLKNGVSNPIANPPGDHFEDRLRTNLDHFRVDFWSASGVLFWGLVGVVFFAFVLFSLLFLMLSCLGFVFVCLFVFWFCFYALVSVAMVDFC